MEKKITDGLIRGWQAEIDVTNPAARDFGDGIVPKISTVELLS